MTLARTQLAAHPPQASAHRTPMRVASVNVNGIRAAMRRGMADWLAPRGVQILCLQEVRASTADLEAALGPGWHIVHDVATAAGRAGVAIASRVPFAGAARTTFGAADFDSAGRWIEVDVLWPTAHGVGAQAARVTVVSCYTHAGEVDTPKQEEKWKCLAALEARMGELMRSGQPVLVTGDFNVGHTERDIRNWKGNVRNAGFLPRERSTFDRLLGPAGEPVQTVDGTGGTGQGWVDVGRAAAGDVEGPYSWWSWRGQAFDRDTGWRIDYHFATPDLAATASQYGIDRAASYDARFSDHAPVVADYAPH